MRGIHRIEVGSRKRNSLWCPIVVSYTIGISNTYTCRYIGALPKTGALLALYLSINRMLEVLETPGRHIGINASHKAVNVRGHELADHRRTGGRNGVRVIGLPHIFQSRLIRERGRALAFGLFNAHKFGRGMEDRVEKGTHQGIELAV